jgi:hypothetical protein
MEKRQSGDPHDRKCSTSYAFGMKSMQGDHCAETTCPCEYYWVHPIIKGDMFFQGNQCTEFHQDE